MYTDPFNPFFIDFKDWGNSNGPANSLSGGTIRYYSDVVGGEVTASPFESFGNYFYGFAGVLGGIPPEVLGYVAGALQTGNDLGERLLGRDGPQDRPHVSKGITDALRAANSQRIDQGYSVFSVNNCNCSTGITGSGNV